MRAWNWNYFTDSKKTISDLIIRGQFLDMTVRWNVPRFCTGSICDWNLFLPLGLTLTHRWVKISCVLATIIYFCTAMNTGWIRVITWKIEGRGALIERLTASLFIHESRVQTPWIILGTLREISLFLLSQWDWAITLMAASSRPMCQC